MTLLAMGLALLTSIPFAHAETEQDCLNRCYAQRRQALINCHLLARVDCMDYIGDEIFCTHILLRCIPTAYAAETRCIQACTPVPPLSPQGAFKEKFPLWID